MSTPNARTLSHRQAKQLAVLLSDDHTPDYLFHNNSEAQFDRGILVSQIFVQIGFHGKGDVNEDERIISSKEASYKLGIHTGLAYRANGSLRMHQTGLTTHALSEERQSILSMAPTDEGSIASSEITTPLDVDVSNPWDNVPLFKAPNAMCNVSEEPELQESSLDTLETEEIQRILPVTRVVQHTVQSEATLSDEGPITSIHFQPTIDTVRRVASSGRLQ
ncbi:SubName: Full=Uncharacterized protein {ECO:0000313/EMBL:CCA73055.1} [Serendipita indica DSM 11827]|nr:SubName: Full=Uncharacterized protein {ECO:0000313/EMBL:CCA73055.1} [Serendipita indica DSM 11827]